MMPEVKKIIPNLSEQSFLNFDENEESTCIESVTLVRYNLAMAIIVVPFLCLITGLIMAVVLYWKIEV
jgi:hypothetical protein